MNEVIKAAGEKNGSKALCRRIGYFRIPAEQFCIIIFNLLLLLFFFTGNHEDPINQ